MTRNVRRITLAPAYILHHRPYRDTSRILEVITRDHGRLCLFARGVRGPKAKLASVLQPFQLLLLSWSGRGEAGTPPFGVISCCYPFQASRAGGPMRMRASGSSSASRIAGRSASANGRRTASSPTSVGLVAKPEQYVT